MSETVKLVRVFLASPGDLQEERRLAKEVVNEVNKQTARHLGYRVELMAWEETLPGCGRPQDIINQDLNRCELFLGMMYKKWGTPPSKDGTYTSGFEEEFKRSLSRYKETGKPDIAIYFKELDELVVNPNDDLKKVAEDLDKINEFKDFLKSEKDLMFDSFHDTNALQKCVRDKITDYLWCLVDSEKENEDEGSTKYRNTEEASDETQEAQPVKSPFSKEGHEFLKIFLDKTEAEDSAEGISIFEVARFRLLSSVMSKPGNDTLHLGVHDANIIYLNKDINFGSREIGGLINCGLENIKHENAPLWHWYDTHTKDVTRKDYLAFKSLIYSNEDASVGALEAMKIIGATLPNEGEHINRSLFVESWLSEERAEAVKIAALSYLKHHGNNEDLPLIQLELDKANSKTERKSLEAILGIQLRYNKGDALKIAFTNQFESFDENLLEELLSVNSTLNDEMLMIGLKHRNKKIRLESLKRLREKGEVNVSELKELENDSSVEIRKAVVDFYRLNNPLLDNNEVKKILIKPKYVGGLANALAAVPYDTEGTAYYDDFLLSTYCEMLEDELTELINKGQVLNDNPYFARCIRYFNKHSKTLRENTDDQFKKYYEETIERFKSLAMSEDVIKKFRSLEDYTRKKLTRKGLDILCKKGDANDLDIIRKNMRSEFVKSSFDEVEFIRKMGEWEDVPFILKAETEYYDKTQTILTIFSTNHLWNYSIANAIYSIGKNRLDELLNIDMSSRILVDLIKICASSKYSKISDDTLHNLLGNKDDTVRKFAVLKSIQSFSKARLRSILEKHIDREENRYYNVIFWLDFGCSVPKDITRSAIKLITNE